MLRAARRLPRATRPRAAPRLAAESDDARELRNARGTRRRAPELRQHSAPFTKDACYLAGLLEVNAFLSAVIRGGFRDEVELLVSGRVCLDDIAALAELRAAGILSRPKYLPRWLSSWETLLPFFAFSSFMDVVDLRPVEEHYRALIKVAEAARPREAPADAGSPAFRDKRGAGG